MHIRKKKGIAIIEALGMMLVLVAMIIVTGRVISANISKINIYEMRDDIRTLTLDETELLELVIKEINNDMEIKKEFLEYLKDNTYEIEYSRESLTNCNLSIGFEFSKFIICERYSDKTIEFRELRIEKEDDNIYIIPKMYKRHCEVK